jgi:hypothetical protein
VLRSLESFRVVFQISSSWRDTYTDQLAKTEVCSPFQGPSGPAPHSHLAVRFTARTLGARPLAENILEKSLRPYAPTKKNTLCMVIKGKEGGGGERMGTILLATKVSSKKRKVVVSRLDSALASEESLSFTRVILVERPI